MAFCVFCGRDVPKSARTKEHVLPMWLLRLTGEPGRPFRLGWDDDGTPILRPASSFQFPACADCNWKYGKTLEKQAQSILPKISEGGSVTVAEVYRLLDWLDKVRVGLWLGYYMLAKESRFSPRYHIETRIAAKDRIAIISVDPHDTQKILSFGGHDNDVFARTQCGLYLRVNNIRILSFSFDYLLSPETGLPFADEQILLPHNPLFHRAILKPGTYRLSKHWPLFERLGGTIFAQPIADTRGLAPGSAANFYFNSRVLMNAKDTVRVSKPSHFCRVLPLQLLSNVDGHYAYYANKRSRLRAAAPGAHADVAFMQAYYLILLDRVLRRPILEAETATGERFAPLELARSHSEAMAQILFRMKRVGLPIPDMSGLIDDVQIFHRAIEERDSAAANNWALSSAMTAPAVRS